MNLLLDLFECLTGGRVYLINKIMGGFRNDGPEGLFAKLSEFLDYLELQIPEYDKTLFENPIIYKG